MAGTWFVMIPPGYASKSDAEKELVDFRVQYPAGSQAWKDASAGRILSPSESGEGQQLVRWKGPFATEAEALAAQNPRQQSVNPANDAVNAAENSSSLSGLDAIGAFFSKLGEANTWIRVAKVITGGVLLIIGLAHLTGAGNAVASAARKVPVPV